jgi:hypothetical protein
MGSLPTNVSLNRTYTTTTTGITDLPQFVFAVMVSGGSGAQFNSTPRNGGAGGSITMAWITAPTSVTIGAGGAASGGSPSAGGQTFVNTYAAGSGNSGVTQGGKVLLGQDVGGFVYFTGPDNTASGSAGSGAVAGTSGFFAGGGGGATTAAAFSGGNSTKFGFTGGTGAGTGTTWGSGGGAGIAGNGTNGSASAGGIGGLGGGGGGAASTGITTGGTGGVGAVLLYW